MSKPAGSQRVISVQWMALPALAFTALMILFPVLYAVYLSLNRSLMGQPMEFVGWSNYLELFKDPLFWNGVRVTGILFVTALSLQLVIGTALAFYLQRIRIFRGPVLAFLVSPFVMPSVVIAMIALVILDPGMGIMNYLLGRVGIPPWTWFSSENWAILAVVAVDVWHWTPFVALIVFGGLQSMPVSVKEAAAIDGATGWRSFVHVTLPMLAPTLVTAAVLRSVDLLRFFDLIYIATQGGPGYSTTTLNILAFKRAFEFSNVGSGATVMIVLTLIVLLVVALFARLRKALTW